MPLESLVALIEERRPPGDPLLAGVTGGVAVGKSTLAASLSEQFAGATPVVAGDSFLWPNTELDSRGLTSEKGFPDTFDRGALRLALGGLRSGGGVEVPVYSHLTYDIDPTARRWVERASTVVVEGLHLTQLAGDLFDVVVHVEADEDDNRRWYVERFLGFCSDAVDDPSSFYRMFVPMSPDEQLAVADLLWEQINVVNLRRHIAPWRDRADIIVSLDGDHRIRSLTG